MQSVLAKQILSTFNKKCFSRFTLELWKLLDINEVCRYQKTYEVPEIGENVFEQHFWEKKNPLSIISKQGYHAIMPFFQPIEIFKETKALNYFDTHLIDILEKYKTRVDKIISSWQYWTDGEYIAPNLMFVTNFENIEKEFYINQIIPKFEFVLEQIDFSVGNIGIGSIDSFIENSSENTIKALNNFLENNKGEISLSFSDGIFSVEEFQSDKYLTNGLLKGSNSPFETIFIEKKSNKTEIIKEFEFLINAKVSESKLEFFLKKYYKEIFGERYDRIETQLWLKFPELDIANRNRRLDIFLRNSIERDWELFELKRSQKLTTTYRDIPTFSSEINHAIQQIRNYEKILTQDKVKQKFAKQGIEYFCPELRLVVGNKPDISNEEWRFLKSTNENGIKIITFEDLVLEMKLRYNLHDNFLNEKNSNT